MFEMLSEMLENVNSDADVVETLIAWLSEVGAMKRIVSFEEAGLLTSDKGVAITMRNGRKFQLTVV